MAADLDTPGPKLGSRIAAQIQEELLRERWPVGHHLGSEPELMARYGVSRSTLREAIRQLEALGSIRMKRGGGGGLIVAEPAEQSVVRTLTTYLEFVDAGLEELFEARIALEVAAAELAALRATDEQIADLRRFMDHLSTVEPQLAEVAAHVQVRHMIAEMTGNPAIALFIDTLNRFTLEGWSNRRSEAFVRPQDFSKAVETKRKVVEAIVAGDSTAAGQAMHDDLAIRLTVLQDFYARHQSADADESSIAKAVGVELKLGQRIANRIAHEIVRDELREGDRMGSEPELLQKYGVSRAVFRESARILESHGLVRTRRGSGGGLIVGRPDPSYTVATAAEFLTHLKLAPRHLEEVRAASAMTAARLAARRGTDEQRQRLRELLAEQLAASGGANMVASTRVQFQIGEMSGNRALALFMRVITATNFPANPSGLPEPAFQQLQESHSALVEAVVSGDEAVARRRMATHIQLVREWLEDAARRTTT